MLLVKTTIGPSSIHGTGLFAAEFISKGTSTYRYNPKFDISKTIDELNSLSPLAKEYFLYYSYYDKKRNIHILPTDHLKHINHSNDQSKINIESTPDEDTAARDIQPGEELLCDYNKFDDQYFERIGLKPENLI